MAAQIIEKCIELYVGFFGILDYICTLDSTCFFNQDLQIRRMMRERLMARLITNITSKFHS